MFKSVCFDRKNHPLGHKLLNKLNTNWYPYNPIENKNLGNLKQPKKNFLWKTHTRFLMYRGSLNSPQDTFAKDLCPVLHRDIRPMKVIKSISPSPVVSFPFWGNTWEEDGDELFESITVTGFLPVIQRRGYGPCYYRHTQSETGQKDSRPMSPHPEYHSLRIAGRKIQHKIHNSCWKKRIPAFIVTFIIIQ